MTRGMDAPGARRQHAGAPVPDAPARPLSPVPDLREEDLSTLAELADLLSLEGSRSDLVDELRNHLPATLREVRVDLGALDESGAQVEAHVLTGLMPGEPVVRLVDAHSSCYARARDGGRHELSDLDAEPELRPLHRAGYRHRLVLPVTLGRTTVGVLAVTTRGAIPTRVAELAVLVAALLSARAHRLFGQQHDQDRHTLQAQVTQLRSTTRVLERTDALTSLPNRAAAFAAIGEARAAGEEAGTEQSFAFIDLDHLKMTNDRLGHGSGDGVLRGVADRLRQLSRTAPVSVFRLGGDEFGALSRGSAEDLRDMLQGVAERLTEDPVEVDGRAVQTAFSAGVYAINGHGQGIEEIVSRAESAAYEAKRSGRGRVLVHVPAAEGGSDTHIELRQMDAVRSAVLAGRIAMVAQPITSAVAGVEPPMDAEVLVRLTDESGHTLLPDDFVALAEQYDVVNALDRAVLTRVVGTLAAGSAEHRVSCNVSPHSMVDQAFVDWAEDLVARSGQGSRLVVELTERLPIGTTAAVRAGMAHLAGCGVKFALDDFGAGTTSYGNLRELPLDVLKVDGVLVRGCLTSAVDLAMLRSSIEVAGALGIRAVAEGVETQEQLERVVQLGAHAVQGYLFGQPRPWPGPTA